MEVASGTMVGLKEQAAVLNGFCPLIDREEEEKEEDLSTESSSIGVASLSDNDDEVQSQLKDNPLQSLDSLEDSLPIKSGLSNFFTGKSKSFASLSEVASSSSDELRKLVNPFNKRRRVLLLACKNSRSRRASYSSLLPLQPQTHAKDGEEEITAAAVGIRRSLRLPAPWVIAASSMMEGTG